MTDTEKIVTAIKDYILKLHSDGFSTHKTMVQSLKNGIDYFVGRTDKQESIRQEIITTCLEEFEEQIKVYNKEGHLRMAETIKTEFVQFVKQINIQQLSELPNIPFERRLSNDESLAFEQRLKNKFDFGSWKDKNYYWEPLANTQNRNPSVYFDDDLFNSGEILKLIEIIKSLSGYRIFKTTEEKLSYEVDTSTLNFHWLESAYSDSQADWIIYISHEATITFSGERLLAEISSSFSDVIKYTNQTSTRIR
jgi:hypothetical protein